MSKSTADVLSSCVVCSNNSNAYKNGRFQARIFPIISSDEWVKLLRKKEIFFNQLLRTTILPIL